MSIPENVYYSAGTNNFHSFEDNKGMGNVFYNKWIKHCKEFPSKPIAILPKAVSAKDQYEKFLKNKHSVNENDRLLAMYLNKELLTFAEKASDNGILRIKYPDKFTGIRISSDLKKHFRKEGWIIEDDFIPHSSTHCITISFDKEALK